MEGGAGRAYGHKTETQEWNAQYSKSEWLINQASGMVRSLVGKSEEGQANGSRAWAWE